MQISDQHIAAKEIDARRGMRRRPDGAVGVVCLLMWDLRICIDSGAMICIGLLQHRLVANLFDTGLR
ncbi:hypothetical protein [Bradyrhizobium sp. DASA03120]|uniref:hypothetical protein n=1 Tax=Bradyrhizobium sp. SMVTL-02 TaxID=3395917 RepID=UPI003F7199A2